MPSELRKLVGVPWVHQGRHPVHGLDCIGLVRQHLLMRGYKFKDRIDYGLDPDGTLWDELTRIIGKPVASGRGCVDSAIDGDVAVMEFARGVPRHVGVIDEFNNSPHLIHSDSSHKRVVHHPIDAAWRRCIVGIWRPV